MRFYERSDIETVKSEFLKEVSSYDTEFFSFSDDQEAVVIDDSLVILMTIYTETATVIGNNIGITYYCLLIQELTYNQIGFKHNHTQFKKHIANLLGVNNVGAFVRYQTYMGLGWAFIDDKIYDPLSDERIVSTLKLDERYELWEGVKYYFILFEFEKKSGGYHRACAYTTIKPQTYVNNLGKRFIRTGSLNSEIRQSLKDFGEYKKEWVGTRRQDILEKHMHYYVIEKYFREKDDVWRYANHLLEQAEAGSLNNAERNTYLRPTNRWVTEEQVLNIVKKLYKQYVVIPQHKPLFLRSSFGGQMSYDIYIQDLKVAIEYQGEQHFHPVDYFGGEESFTRQAKRDKEKLQLSKEHGISLVYINYDEVISTELIKEKVDEAINHSKATTETDQKNGHKKKVIRVKARVKQQKKPLN